MFSRRIFFFAAECIWKAPSRAKFSRNQIYRGKHTRKSYGTRYLDPKYSRWISTDPALGEYIPAAGKANATDMANLPGMGGIFNHTNAGLFHYAGNNPVRYIDPTGMYEQDHEDKVYSFDIRNKSDFDDVASIMMDKQREGYVARGFDSNTGNYIEFNSYSGMLKFSEATRDPFSLNEVIDCANFIASGLSNILTVGSVANEVYKSEIVNGAISFDGFLTKPGYLLFAASAFFDMRGLFKEPNIVNRIDRITNIGISAVGTFGRTHGLYVYIGLCTIKKCIEGYAFASEQLGKYKIYEERKLVNSISQFYFGRNIK